MLHFLKRLSVNKIRAMAKSYREVAARNEGYQQASQSYLRPAERYDRFARERRRSGGRSSSRSEAEPSMP
jgi:hypothetical protein